MRFKKLFWIILLIITLFTISLPNGKEKKAYELIYEDIQVIKKQLKALEEKVELNSKRIDEIYELVKTLSTQMVALQRVQADLTRNSEYFQAKLQLIMEKLDETNKQIIKTQEELLALRGLREIPVEEKAEVETGTPQSTEASEEAEQKGQEIPSVFISPQQIYNTAYSDYLKGNYQLAIEGFRQYIENFRESPLADNAQYWIGECYFSQGDYYKAIEEFNKLILNFPQGDKVPAAFLKKGYSYFALGEKEKGIAVLK
ncbi:tetratricopeptide repeat protein, partial [Candidatus Aminicenantes bacterium AC-708-M15]|nr:tetratricopeptide repeat protein [Candidatus Aminicenantes bacterium AC-708-M15]